MAFIVTAIIGAVAEENLKSIGSLDSGACALISGLAKSTLSRTSLETTSKSAPHLNWHVTMQRLSLERDLKLSRLLTVLN